MSEYFEAGKDCPAQRRAMGAYIQALLQELLPPMRMAARGCGYAIAVHGSEQRDVDLVAIPWTASADDAELLVKRLTGVIAGVLGRAIPSRDWADKPHGRRALSIITSGDTYIDLSIMPRVADVDAEPPAAEAGDA